MLEIVGPGSAAPAAEFAPMPATGSIDAAKAGLDALERVTLGMGHPQSTQ